MAAVRANAEQRAGHLRTIVDDMRSQGFTSVRTIAAQLNGTRWLMASNVSGAVVVAAAGVTSTETTRSLRNEPHTGARLARKTPTHPISQIFAKACRSLAACNGVGVSTTIN